MSQGASSYPISNLLHRLTQQYGPSPTEFIVRLGYRNIERGLLRLQSWIESGDGYPRIIRQIAATYPAIAAELDFAIDKTRAIKKTESEAGFLEQCKAEADNFHPFLHVQGEKTVPNGITLFGVSGGHRRWTTIEIPKSTLDLPLEEQLKHLPELMQGYLKEHNGHCPFFGQATGFRFVRLTDFFQFDKDGAFIGHVDKPYRCGS